MSYDYSDDIKKSIPRNKVIFQKTNVKNIVNFRDTELKMFLKEQK